MSDANTVTCPGCNTSYKAANEAIGRKLRCSKCGTRFTAVSVTPSNIPEPVQQNEAATTDPFQFPEPDRAAVSPSTQPEQPKSPTPPPVKTQRAIEGPSIPGGAFTFVCHAIGIFVVGGVAWAIAMDAITMQYGRKRFSDEYADPAAANAVEHIQHIIERDFRPFVITFLLVLILMTLWQINAAIRFYIQHQLDEAAALKDHSVVDP